MSFQVKDSGSRQQFDSGMVRDTQQGKTLYHLLYDGPMYDRWAEHLTKGAAKYSEGNWLQAQGDEELRRFRASAARHFRQWMRGDADEDHAAAVFFNINGVEYVRGLKSSGEKIKSPPRFEFFKTRRTIGRYRVDHRDRDVAYQQHPSECFGLSAVKYEAALDFIRRGDWLPEGK